MKSSYGVCFMKLIIFSVYYIEINIRMLMIKPLIANNIAFISHNFFGVIYSIETSVYFDL